MTEQPRFDDDIDTVSTCTGACCDPVTLGVDHYRALSHDPTSFRNGRYIVTMLKARGPLPRDGEGEFDCRYFDRGTRRCVAYDRRPEMCRTFPETGHCHYCGGRFATERPPTPVRGGGTRLQMAKLAAMRSLIKDTGTSVRPSPKDPGR